MGLMGLMRLMGFMVLTIIYQLLTLNFSTGVGVFVDLFEVLAGHVGVDLGGGEVGVAEQLFDGLDVASFVEDVGGEAVAEHVGADAVGVGEKGHVFSHRAVDLVGADLPAFAVHEEPFARSFFLLL